MPIDLSVGISESEKWTAADRPRAAGGRWTKKENRSDKIARGRKIATLMRAGATAKRIGLELTDAQEAQFVEDVAEAETVREWELDKTVKHGTRKGQRRPLTKRQAEVLQEYADGLLGDEIATKWGCGRQNVTNLTASAKFATDSKTLSEAVAKAIGGELIRAPELPVYATKGSKPVLNARRRERYRAKRHLSQPDGALSVRQTEILALTADGLTSERVAAQVGVNEEMVKDELKRISRLLGTTGKMQAVVFAVRRGII